MLLQHELALLCKSNRQKLENMKKEPNNTHILKNLKNAVTIQDACFHNTSIDGNPSTASEQTSLDFGG